MTNVSRRRCRLTCACLAGVLAILGPARRAEAGPVPPSILIVLMDDARFDGVPWLDEMAEEGVRFTHAYATEPHCGPSRAALLTGRFRTIEVNGTTEGFDDSDTLATRMRAAGYQTAFIGKYINGHAETGAPPGWDRFLVFSGGDHYYDYALVDEQGTLSTPADYSTDYLADAVQDFFSSAESSAEGPAFAIFAPLAPHVDPAASLLPVPAPRHAGAFAGLPPHRPPSYDHTIGKPAYLRNALQIGSDGVRQLGMEATLAVAEALDQIRSQFPELIVFVTSDNGAGWGEHGWHWQKKNCPHLICTHVPFAAFGPWAPRETAAPIRLEDLSATVLHLAGADPADQDGSELTPLLEHGDDAVWPRTSLPLHYGGTIGPQEVPRWDGEIDFASERLLAFYETGEEEEYDLAADPWLLWNIAVLPEPGSPLLQGAAVLTALLLRRRRSGRAPGARLDARG